MKSYIGTLFKNADGTKILTLRDDNKYVDVSLAQETRYSIYTDFNSVFKLTTTCWTHDQLDGLLEDGPSNIRYKIQGKYPVFRKKNNVKL